VFVPGRPSQSSLMLVDKARSLKALLVNLRLGWKGLQGTNTLDYHDYKLQQ
jgi:hypothetical protein